jgi:hypothetical protein
MVRCFHFGEGLGAALEHGDWIGRCRFHRESSLGLFSFFSYILMSQCSSWLASSQFGLLLAVFG